MFISSVTTRMTQEREAAIALVQAIGMIPVHFENFGASAMSSRQRCLDAVAESDVYVLLLGGVYGQPDPTSGRAPTHEEFEVARSCGIPILVFKKAGVHMEPAQAAFAAEVGRYATGLFWAEFSDSNSLLLGLGPALRDLPVGPVTLQFSALGHAVEPDWMNPPGRRDPFAHGPTDARIELYLTPMQAVGASRVRAAGAALGSILRTRGRIDDAVGIQRPTSAGDDVKVVVDRPNTGGFNPRGETPESLGGLTLSAIGEACAWSRLAHDSMGVLVNRGSLNATLTQLVDLSVDVLAQLFDDPSGVPVVGSAAIIGTDWVNIGDPSELGHRQSMTLGSGRPATLFLPGNESVDLGALRRASGDLASEIAEQLLAKIGATTGSFG